MKNKTFKIVFLFICMSFFLMGCMGGPSPEEQMYETLEKVVTLEKDFEKEQDPLVELEKKEKELYDEILTLGMKEFDQIVTLSNEALSIVADREKRIDNEHESIKASKKEFQKVESIITEIKEDSVKNEAKDLVSLMNQRYESYEELFASYNEAIEQDKTLYEMFQNKELTLDELEKQINLINETYEKVVAANETFNKLTDQYNKAKVSFYKNAGLEVVFKEEE
ncbi:YkyA family protein [Bacillus timonensis]|uniref:YkyA family protein n=1 Tax=Bacillus timonensis TaxID=1033734 RepID=UPI0002897346|nr:YkyA family protein [Bacillus timonensis]